MGKLPVIKVDTYSEFVRPKADRCGDRVGLATGLVLTHYLNELFFANYENELNDATLMAATRKEYPKRGVIQSMAAYRSYFNAGLHGHGWGGWQANRRTPLAPLP